MKKIIFKRRASAILYLFLRSLNSKGVFLLPANICPIVPITLMKANVQYEFIDINNKNYCIDFKKVKNKIKQTNKYKGLIFVHTYGIEKDFNNKFKELKEIENNFIIIDDKSLCKPKFTLSDTIYADLILYSTGYGKMVDLGYGGYGFLLNGSIDLTNEISKYNKNDLKELEIKYKKAFLEKQNLSIKILIG